MSDNVVKSNVSETLQNSRMEELGSFLYDKACITCGYSRLIRHVFFDMSWYDVCPKCGNESDDEQDNIEDDR